MKLCIFSQLNVSKNSWSQQENVKFCIVQTGVGIHVEFGFVEQMLAVHDNFTNPKLKGILQLTRTFGGSS